MWGTAKTRRGQTASRLLQHLAATRSIAITDRGQRRDGYRRNHPVRKPVTALLVLNQRECHIQPFDNFLSTRPKPGSTHDLRELSHLNAWENVIRSSVNCGVRTDIATTCLN